MRKRFLSSFLVFCLGAMFATIAHGDAIEDARAILAKTGVKGGLIVHIGCGDGG